jgi:hypothetical protein
MLFSGQQQKEKEESENTWVLSPILLWLLFMSVSFQKEKEII